MPASDTQVAQQGGRAPVILFWSGVALAPIAALLLLVGGDATLRVAVAMVIGAVVLVGLSITLRREGDTLRLDLEDMVFDEVDAARADMRDDIAHAAQTTHHAFGEKLQYLLEQLEATRGELEATRGQLESLRNAVGAGQAGGQQPSRHRSNGSGPMPAATGPDSRHHEQAPPNQDAHRAPRSGPPGMGRVRHTETVKVTTRHTVVDPHDEPRGTVYSSGAHAAEPGKGHGSGNAAGHPSGHASGNAESWTEQRLREQISRRRDEDVQWTDRGRDRDWGDDDSRPGVRAGDRWASVRSDDHGRELQIGERRASLHADNGGAELRIEDRWAAVRREERLDEPYPGFPWRDRSDERRDRGDDRRPAITGSDRAERWSDYEYDDRDRDRRRY